MSTTFKLTVDQVSALTSLLSTPVGPGSGLRYDGKSLTVPEALVTEVSAIMAVSGWDASWAQDQLFAYASTKRYEVETGGITVNGAEIATTRDSQAMIRGIVDDIAASGAQR